MKLKCGKCSLITEGDPQTEKISGKSFLKCIHCNTVNWFTMPADIKKNAETTNTKKEETEILVKPKPPGTASNSKDISPGWIFIHDENTKDQSFDLKLGHNIIGRKASTTPPEVEIQIVTSDGYMSRKHCDIEIVKRSDDSFQFRLSDKSATNGTLIIINGMPQKKLNTDDVFIIKDGDTLQLGMTKIVVRMYNRQSNNREQVHNEVKSQPYAPTVMVSKN